MIQKILNRIILFFTTKERLRKRWPVAPQLQDIHIRNCRLLADRTTMLQHMPQNGVYAELGIWKGDYSEKILKHLNPQKLHLADTDSQAIEYASVRFRDQIETGTAELHQSDSSKFLLSQPDQSFDWIYIDGDHSYAGVRRDLEAAHKKIKPYGFISLNDYIFLGSTDLSKYGVIEATNEFCINFGYELIFFALHGRMYCDVTIRKIAEV